jgi:predicted patatin/cPLA2 family phospholipase
LTSCSLPINIPNKLKNLTKLAKGDSNIDNACQAYSLVRNKIIHPSSKRRKEITKSEHVFEAKLLGSKFIELFVLYKSNYQGSYFNRVNYDAWKGKVETVPWV